jgi:hypothetical protein
LLDVVALFKPRAFKIAYFKTGKAMIALSIISLKVKVEGFYDDKEKLYCIPFEAFYFYLLKFKRETELIKGGILKY